MPLPPVNKEIGNRVAGAPDGRASDGLAAEYEDDRSMQFLSQGWLRLCIIAWIVARALYKLNSRYQKLQLIRP